jgi:hypothetical protein
LIWDVHCHFPRNFENPAEEQHERIIDSRADALRAAGVTRASLLCGGRMGLSYEDSLVYARRHEELFLPSAAIDPEEVDGREVRRLHELGYRGLKIIGRVARTTTTSTSAPTRWPRSCGCRSCSTWA